MITFFNNNDLKQFWNDTNITDYENFYKPNNLIRRFNIPNVLNNSWFNVQKFHTINNTKTTEKINNENISFVTNKTQKIKKSEKQEKEEKEYKMKKIKFIPTKEQIKVLKKWWNDYRYTYNYSLWLRKETDLTNISKLKLRNMVTPEVCNSTRTWILETPKGIREQAVFELCKNYNSCYSNYKAGNIDFFEIKYLTKKNPKWSIRIPSNAFKIYNTKNPKWKNKIVTIFPKKGPRGYKNLKITGNSPLFRMQEPLPSIKHDSIIHFDGLSYYLCIPVDIENQDKKLGNNIVSLDPGVRTFQTMYSLNGECYKLGHNNFSRIFKILLWIDNNISKTSKNNKIRILKARRKIKRLINEMHNKIINFLCNYSKIILLPKFETKQMIKNVSRKINKKCVRNMCTYSHFKFQQKLIHKARETGTKILIVNESYTSKTCGSCGFINNNLNSNKIYKCPNCKITIDRDFNGARNILLRAMRVAS